MTPRFGPLTRVTAASRRRPWIGVVGVATGVAVAVVLLLGAGPHAARSVVVALSGLLLAAAFWLPGPQREVAAATVVGGWAVVAAAAHDSWQGWSVQTSGAVLLAVTACWAARVAAVALADDTDATTVADERAALLTAVLQLRSLHPGEVIEALLDAASGMGARDVGWWEGGSDDADVGDVDPDHDPAWGPLGRTARATAGPRTSEQHGDRRIIVPVGDESVAGVLVATVQDPATEAAVRSLAEEAGFALARARRYEADAVTVAELRRLDQLTHDVVSTVSHELRTPTTVVAGLSRTLSRRDAELDATRRGDLLRRIDDNATRLAAMLRSLTDSSALERGELTVQPQAVELRSLVAAVTDRLEAVLARHTLVVALGPETVRADPDLLAHVLENLLGNAARHTPSGTRVRVASRPSADGVVEVSICDQGPGIAPDHLPHVLERFWRAEPGAGGGLGLGLSLAQQILLAHGSRLEVRSAPGDGACFSFRLPADSPARARPGR